MPRKQTPKQDLVQAQPEPLHPPLHLPDAKREGRTSLEECLHARRSTRNFTKDRLSLEDLGQLLWAAQGVTGLGGLRTAPSPGALFPLRVYVTALNVGGLVAGVYRYNPDLHTLRLMASGNRRAKLLQATHGQQCADEAAVAVLLAASYTRAIREFGEASTRLVQIEAGHIGQNFCLQATALGLGAVGLGRIDADAMREALQVPDREEPVYLLLAGHRS